MDTEHSIFGADPDQLRELVQSGLEADDMEGSEDAPASETVEGLIEPPRARIGRYKLLQVLGEGGMGMVHLAEQEGAIRRKVALKVIKPGMDSKRVIARFQIERQALALLDHPNVAQVYDAGTTKIGRPYFVMEYVKGLPITEYCDRHRLTIEQRLRLFQQVCAAVQHAHQKGIIHRDIKPSNILVSAENDRAIPKIIDFGVAKAMSQPLTEQTLFTEDNRLLGTPEYMSPEQAEMVNEDIDTRSDIYSLGVLLYVLLTGALPYDSKTFRQGGLEHVRQTIRQVDPKTPSTRLAKLGDEATKVAENRRTEVATLAKCLHRELEWIPLKAMRKERAERYRSASELADDIDNYLNGAPLMAGPPTTGYRFVKFLRRHKALVGSTAAVLLVSVIGTLVSVTFALGQANALAENRAMATFLNRDILIPLGHESFKPASMRDIFDSASENLTAKFADYPLLEASVRYSFGRIYGWQFRDCDVAVQHLERAVDIRRDGNLENLFDAMNYLALAYKGAGRYHEAEAMFSEMVESIEARRKRDGREPSPFYYAISSHLGDTWRLMGRYDEAEPYIREAPLHPWWSKGHWREFLYVGRIANLLRDQGHYERAKRLYEELLQNRRRFLNEKDLNIMREFGIMKEFGILYTLQGDFDAAAPLLQKALEGIQKEHGEEHHGITADYKIALAVLRTKQGRYEDAETLFEEGLRNLHNVRNDDHPALLRAKNHIGVLYREQGRYDEAENLLREVCQRQTQSKELGPDHPHTLESTHELALAYVAQEDYDKAEPLLLDAHCGRETKLGLKHPHTVDSLRELANLYEAWNKPNEAAKWRAKLLQAETKEE